jgi:hypothetical protein
VPGARSGCFPGDTSAGLKGLMRVVSSSIGIERLVCWETWIVAVACWRDIANHCGVLTKARAMLKWMYWLLIDKETQQSRRLRVMVTGDIECSAFSMFRWKPLRNDDSILHDVIDVAVSET